MSPGVRVGADVGGTFTDVVVATDDGRLLTRKVPSTTGRYAEAIISALAELRVADGLDSSTIDEVLHGTTVATNAVLEHKGARVALLTTRGFKDVLAIARLRMPVLYDMNYEKPRPLVERDLRLELDERVDADGSVHSALDAAHAREQVREAVARGAEALAVCLINSYINATHEQLVARIARQEAPGLFLSVSSEILPEIGEYERTSTTAVNAYLGPVVAHYLSELERLLRAAGVRAPVRIMQSNGGTMSATTAAQKPVYIVESGPAAGVIGAQALAQRIGLANLVSFDMGGTTAKASIIEQGELTWANEFEVGGPVSLGARLMRGGGYAISLPALDVAEVGAGGGSIVRIDAGGALQVGPRSAGAVPGPVAYDTGGTEPTVTDANILLGYINPSFVAGGAVRLNAGKARRVFQAQIAAPLRLGVEQAAFGVSAVANSNMIRAINAVSTERGRDPRQFALFAYGGSGPIHAAAIAKELGITRVLVPPSPGLFSAYGLFFAQTEYRASRTLVRAIRPALGEELESEYRMLEERLVAEIREAYGSSDVKVRRLADLRYHGQAYALTVPAPRAVSASSIGDLTAEFERAYLKSYGHSAPGQPVELTTLRVVGALPSRDMDTERTWQRPARGDRAASTRQAYFGPARGWLETPVVDRDELRSVQRAGPLIVEEYDATTVVPPDWTVRLDPYQNLVIEVRSGG